jgi:hypothetical protein
MHFRIPFTQIDVAIIKDRDLYRDAATGYTYMFQFIKYRSPIETSLLLQAFHFGISVTYINRKKRAEAIKEFADRLEKELLSRRSPRPQDDADDQYKLH